MRVLIGLQQFRILGKLAGFRIDENRYVLLSKESLFLFPFFYPLVLVHSLLAYAKHMRKDKGMSKESKRAIHREQLMLNIRPRNLMNRHTFLVFEKERPHQEVPFDKEQVQQSLGQLIEAVERVGSSEQEYFLDLS